MPEDDQRNSAPAPMASHLQTPHGMQLLLTGHNLSIDELSGQVKKHKRRTEVLTSCATCVRCTGWPGRMAIVVDNYDPHLFTVVDTRIGDRAAANNVKLTYVPFWSARLNRIELQPIALCFFALDGTDHPSHCKQDSLIRRYFL